MDSFVAKMSSHEWEEDAGERRWQGKDQESWEESLPGEKEVKSSGDQGSRTWAKRI